MAEFKVGDRVSVKPDWSSEVLFGEVIRVSAGSDGFEYGVGYDDRPELDIVDAYDTFIESGLTPIPHDAPAPAAAAPDDALAAIRERVNGQFAAGQRVRVLPGKHPYKPGMEGTITDTDCLQAIKGMGDICVSFDDEIVLDFRVSELEPVITPADIRTLLDANAALQQRVTALEAALREAQTLMMEVAMQLSNTQKSDAVNAMIALGELLNYTRKHNEQYNLISLMPEPGYDALTKAAAALRGSEGA